MKYLDRFILKTCIALIYTLSLIVCLSFWGGLIFGFIKLFQHFNLI